MTRRTLRGRDRRREPQSSQTARRRNSSAAPLSDVPWRYTYLPTAHRPGDGVVGDARAGRVRSARVNSYRSVDPIASSAKRLSPTCAFQRARGWNPTAEPPWLTGSRSRVTVPAVA
jgi:hypothetical protein